MVKMGLQLYSIKEEIEKDFLGTVEKVADMGYDGVQFAGFYETPAAQVKELLQRKHITSAGAHVPFDQLQGANLDRTFSYHQAIGNDLLICPYYPKEELQTKDDFIRLAESLNEIGQKCRENGFLFAYHNHDFEFKKFNGKTGFEMLFDYTREEYVKLELDCYWAVYAGFDPRKIMDKYENRVISLHIKDIKVENNQKVSTEIGAGELDITGIIDKAVSHNVQWFIVEQEHFERDMLESTMWNARTLRSLIGM